MTETSEFPDFMGRLLRRWGERVGEADTYDLAELVAFGAQVEEVIIAAICDGRAGENGWSWTQIANDLGLTRQGARQKYERKVKALEAVRGIQAYKAARSEAVEA